MSKVWKMGKVWLVTTGIYSDYRVQAVFSTERSLLTMTIKMILSALLFAATSVATAKTGFFDPPTTEDIRAEQERCLKSWLCHTFISGAPADITAYTAVAPLNCEERAEFVRAKLGRGTIQYGHVRLSKTVHTILVVDGWVVDTGALSKGGVQVFPETELMVLMKKGIWKPL